MEDTNIEIQVEETVVSDPSVVLLPMNFVSVGTVEHDSVQVYIKQNVYKRIEKFAKEEMSKEVGSILVGEYVDEEDRKTVIISDYIEAKHTDASASTLTFTHETWDYVHEEMDKKHSDKNIVGWQHTHPGYGIFLSNYDLFIQENFFNLPWQIAYVVDPIADTRGFFEWKNGKVTKMSGFYVYDDVDKQIKISEKTKPAKKLFSPLTAILALLLALSVLLTISFGIEKNNILKKLNDVLSTQSQSMPESISGTDTETFRIYVVQDGDFLEDILEKNNLDYKKNASKVLKINGISDADMIYAGQTLYLPME